MTLVIHSVDIPRLEKHGYSIPVKDLQILLHLYISSGPDVVIFKHGKREEIIKGPFVKQYVIKDSNEIERVLKKYRK